MFYLVILSSVAPCSPLTLGCNIRVLPHYCRLVYEFLSLNWFYEQRLRRETWGVTDVRFIHHQGMLFFSFSKRYEKQVPIDSPQISKYINIKYMYMLCISSKKYSYEREKSVQEIMKSCCWTVSAKINDQHRVYWLCVRVKEVLVDEKRYYDMYKSVTKMESNAVIARCRMDGGEG